MTETETEIKTKLDVILEKYVRAQEEFKAEKERGNLSGMLRLADRMNELEFLLETSEV